MPVLRLAGPNPMASITPFPTPDQRQVLRELDGLAAEFHLSAEQRDRVRSRFLDTVRQGRSTAVAVGEARAVVHGRQQTNRGPSAA